jgi:hypothetical protein
MFLVHSFPRRVTVNEHREKIFRILDLFLKNGPLLVPEVIQIPAVPGNKYTQNKFEVLQRRFSLTLINESEIKSHMQQFGPISLVFDSENLLHSGVTPTLYYPNYCLGRESNEFGLSLLHHLRMILRLVQDTSFIAGINHDDYQKIINRKCNSHEYRSFRSSINTLFNIMEIDERQLVTMEGAIQSLSELLYPADRSSNEEEASFNYFRQREWRLLGNFVINGKQTTQKATQELRTELINIDYDFYNKNIKFQKSHFKLIDEVQTLREPYKTNFISGIKRIYCCHHLYDEVTKLVRNKNIVVTLLK